MVLEAMKIKFVKGSEKGFPMDNNSARPSIYVNFKRKNKPLFGVLGDS